MALLFLVFFVVCEVFIDVLVCSRSESVNICVKCNLLVDFCLGKTSKEMEKCFFFFFLHVFAVSCDHGNAL